jgi:hypothetical protein
MFGDLNKEQKYLYCSRAIFKTDKIQELCAQNKKSKIIKSILLDIKMV